MAFYRCGGSSVSKPTLLWTNPNPNADFAPQRISLDLSQYTKILVKLKGLPADIVDANVYSTGAQIFDVNGTPQFVATQFNNAGTVNCIRGITSITNTGLVFGAGSTTVGNNGNSYCIPLEIYGIKKSAVVKQMSGLDYIFKNGNQYNDITGGFSGYHRDYTSTYNGEFSIGDVLHIKSSIYATAAIDTNNLIDITGIDSIICKGLFTNTSQSPSDGYMLGLVTSHNINFADVNAAIKSNFVRSVPCFNGCGCLNVSDLSGYYYVRILVSQGNAGGNQILDANELCLIGLN